MMTLFAPFAMRGQSFPDQYLTMTSIGPTGTRFAHVGESVTAVLRFHNLHERLDSILLTNVIHFVHHAGGWVISSNLLPTPVLLAANQSIRITNRYPVLPGDGPILSSGAWAEGTDLHDGENPTYIPSYLGDTFPGEVTILTPALGVRQSGVITGPAGARQFSTSGVVSNLSGANTPLKNVLLIHDRGTPGNTNDDLTLAVGTLNVGQSVPWLHAWPILGGSLTNTVVVRGTDDAGLTVWATNRVVVVVHVPVAAPLVVRAGFLRLRWGSQPDTAYQVQARGALDLPWENLGFQLIASSTNTAVDLPMTSAQSFYRVFEPD
jgi:hypothetical protein